MKKYILSALFLVANLTSTPSFATDMENAEHLTFSLGYANVLRSNKSTEFGVDYKSEAVFQETWDSFMPFTIHTRPRVGGYITNDSARYIYGGAAIDAPLSERWNLAMHAVFGYYSDGSDLDLGGPLSFREGIGLEYLFDNGSRAGFSFNHNSNAFLYRKNPGSESLLLNYSHPINFVK